MGADGEQQVAAIADEELLVRFAIWRLRYGDLPADVAVAASRLVESGIYPHRGEVLCTKPQASFLDVRDEDRSRPGEVDVSPGELGQ